MAACASAQHTAASQKMMSDRNPGIITES
jgi:hypothetical protein